MFQASFLGHDAGSLAPYAKGDVMGQLGRTNFKLSDGHGTFDTYQSTAKDSYQAVRSTRKYIYNWYKQYCFTYTISEAILRSMKSGDLIEA